MNVPITAATPAQSPGRRRPGRAILWGGLIAGTIDIGAASLIFHANPLVILRAVAGGLLGKAAHQGGLATSVLGLVLQWGMSVLIAAIFVFAALRIPSMLKRPIAAGIAYGIVVFFVMNDVVVPLSALGPQPPFTRVLFAENMLAMLVFGLIIAFVASRCLEDRGRPG